MFNKFMKYSMLGLAVSQDCGPEYNGTPDSGCFQAENELCKIANPSCISLQCSASGMNGFLRGDALGFDISKELPESSDLMVNDVSSCLGITRAGSGYNVALNYGDCDMIITQNNGKITFKSVVSVSDDSDHGKMAVEIQNNLLGLVQDGEVVGGEYFSKRPILFSCEFTDKKTTTKTLKLAASSLDGLGISQTDLDFDLALNFYDQNFVNILDENIEQKLFGFVNIEVSMVNPIGSIEFFIENCNVSDGDLSVAVISDSCPMEVLGVNDHGNRLSSNNLQYSWKAFAFNESAGTHTLTVTCQINFCLKGDCDLKDCNEDKNETFQFERNEN